MPSIKDNVDIMFSCLSGYNLYQTSETKYNDSDGETCAVHCQNGTEVKIRRGTDNLSEKSIEKWNYFVEHPIDISTMLWPIDVVSFEKDSEIGLVFRRRAFPKLEPLKTLVYNEMVLGWGEEKIQKLIVNFLKRCIDLHKNGYLYHSFSLDKMFYNPVDMTVVFDFSPSVARMDSTSKVDTDELGIEFLPPWCEMHKDNEMGIFEENYTIAAILFKLMIGRMPYQGRLMNSVGGDIMMNHLTDTDYDTHVMMFEKYYEHPVFVFDPNDTSNVVGVFTSHQKYYDRWETLPKEIQKMFLDALVIQKGKSAHTASSEEWLNAFEKTILNRSEGEGADD